MNFVAINCKVYELMLKFIFEWRDISWFAFKLFLSPKYVLTFAPNLLSANQRTDNRKTRDFCVNIGLTENTCLLCFKCVLDFKYNFCLNIFNLN